MNKVYHLFSQNGDEYKLCLSTEGWPNLSSDVFSSFGLELISVELVRIKGDAVTSSSVLTSLESIIADCFFERHNAVLFYYCDFLNPIPSSRKTMPPQEYRSRLFSLMFERYCSHHSIKDVSEVKVVINGLDCPYYFHLISRNSQLDSVRKIAFQLQTDFEK